MEKVSVRDMLYSPRSRKLPVCPSARLPVCPSARLPADIERVGKLLA